MVRGFDRQFVVWLLAACLALAGCGGGAVVVRSDFSGNQGAAAVAPVPKPPAVAPAPSTPKVASSSASTPGLTVSGGRNLGLAIVLTLVVTDGVNWIGNKLREAFGIATPVSRNDAAPAVPAR